MRFTFYVRYPASFFTVVDNLSLWSIYSHEQYRRHWVEKYGLTDVQKLLLDRYSSIREKYPWHKMEPFFMNADTMEDALIMASSSMKTEEIRMLREIFDAFRETFDEEWRRHDYLLRRKRTFEWIFQRYDIEQAFDEVKSFYAWKEIPPDIDVHLLYNPSINWGGGGSHAGVQLEVRQDECEETINKDFAVLLHEAFHILESMNDTREKLRGSGDDWKEKVLPQAEGDVCELITEAVMDTIVPDGVIAQKYLNVPEKRELPGDDYWQKRLQEAGNEKERERIFIRKLREELTGSLLPITRSYLEERRTVWDSYWSKALNLYFQLKQSIST